MRFFYKKKKKIYIKKCLLNFNTLEKEILKTILKNKEQYFPLTKNSPITKKFLDLNILFKLKDDPENSLNSIYFLNTEIFHIVKQDLDLKQIFLK
jgi:hypothetical protein